MTFQLMTDSGADLSARMKTEWGIKVVPLFVHFGEQQYASEQLTTAVFLKKLKESSQFPSSSAPGPHEYHQAFKAIEPTKPIIHISISSGVSSSYNHAIMGRDMLLEEEPNRKIVIIDSKSASTGMMLLINEALTKMAENLSFEQISIHLAERVNHLRTLFVLQSLDNLIRGGRLDKVKGAVAKTLNVKLILHASSEGKIEVLEKVRGNKKATRRFIEKIGEYVSRTSNQTLAMTHCNAADRLEEFSTKLKDTYSFEQILTAETGPVISAHAGQGAIVISFFSDHSRNND
ncbi:EDD domain protein, DegV family [Amphibacillus marinus]|uniref:EDD domain protein, DegV family n=1 Tax=Amphibacillus marinus TaxID=872970 RepID=A0A1H8JPB5_9BACI|nr:DegV family protein [Amphibacillus marinus]SEN82570.1 EDD domain protein, DegV family [Amphibacillus marinus]